MTMKKPASSSGFTLAELIVAAGVTAAIVGVVLMIFISGRNLFISSEAATRVQENARQALNSMVAELYQAGGQITVAASALTFQTALGYNLSLAGCSANAGCWGARDQNGTLQPGWSVRYRVDQGTLIREVLDGGVAQSQRVVANLVDAGTTQFAGDQTPPKKITITLGMRLTDASLPGGARTLIIRAQARLRNS